MMDRKVTTMIVNATKQGLTMKVGNRQCYAKLTSVKVGGEYKMRMDVNWTYQEFVVQDRSHSHHPLFVNSDDCCDYEHVTIKKNMDGEFDVERHLRKQFRTSCSAIEDSSNTPSTWKLWLYKFIYTDFQNESRSIAVDFGKP